MPRSPRPSRSWATEVLLIAALLCPARASAVEPESRAYVLDGQPGMWFPMVKARKLLEDVAQLPGIKLQLELLEKRLILEKERTGLLDRNVQTTEKIAVTWKATAETQARLLVEKDPWWKSPYLWLTVGVVVGSAATIGIAQAVKRAD